MNKEDISLLAQESEENYKDENSLSLKEEVEAYLKDKSINTDISVEEIINEAGLDLDFLDSDKLAELKLEADQLEFLKKDIEGAIDDYCNNIGESRLLNFINKHNKIITLTELGIYLSAFGPALFKNLAGSDLTLEIGNKKISIDDLIENPDLAKEIDSYNSATPIDIAAIASSLQSFEKGDIEFNFQIKNSVSFEDSDDVEKTIFFGNIAGNSEKLNYLKSDLSNIGVSFDYEKGGCSIEDFFNKKDEILDIFSKDLGVSEENLETYFDNFISPNISDLSIVKLEDFNINKDLKEESSFLEAKKMKDKVYEEYNVLDDNGFYQPDNWMEAEEYLDKIAEEKGYKNFQQIIDEELEKYDNSNEKKIKALEPDYVYFENHDKFSELFMKALEEDGYPLDKLKEIGEENPEKIIDIIAEVIAKNVEYDHKEKNILHEIISARENDDKDKEEKEWSKIREKHEKGIGFITLDSGKGVCHDYSATFLEAKRVLKEKGVPNLDKFACLYTSSGKQNHAWNALATINNEGGIDVTYIDSTWYDSSGNLDATNEKHYFGSIKGEIDKAHETILKEINKFNVLHNMEKLKEVLTQRDLDYDKKKEDFEK